MFQGLILRYWHPKEWKLKISTLNGSIRHKWYMTEKTGNNRISFKGGQIFKKIVKNWLTKIKKYLKAYYKSPGIVLDTTRAQRAVLRHSAPPKLPLQLGQEQFNNQGTNVKSCALDSKCRKGMWVGQSGNTLWRKYIFSRVLKEVKWRIYTEEKKAST